MATLVSNLSDVSGFQRGLNSISIENDLVQGFSSLEGLDGSWVTSSSSSSNVTLVNASGETVQLSGTFSDSYFRATSFNAQFQENVSLSATGSITVWQDGTASGYINTLRASSPSYTVEIAGSIWPFSQYATSTVSSLKLIHQDYSIELAGTYNINLDSGALTTVNLSYGDQSLSISGSNFNMAQYTESDFDLDLLYRLALTGNDLLLGSEYDDVFNAYAGNDVVYAGFGNDLIDGGIGRDYLDGAAGNDTIYGGLDADLLLGGSGADVLYGGQGDDQLLGGRGWDDLQGGQGNDILRGALGTDTLTGGAGSDAFRFETPLDPQLNIDTITDFVSGVDRMELSASIFTAFADQVGQTVGLNQYLQYNQSTGYLSYDADGSGSGAAVPFAILGTSSHPSVGTDFLIV
jgi:Ca2+-binding RTX toxin-like protein